MATEVITAYSDIPYGVISTELEGQAKVDFEAQLAKIKECYSIYKKGAPFNSEGSNGDYTPSDLRYKKSKSLIDKEARFLFSNPPDCKVSVIGKNRKILKDESSIVQDLIDNVLKKNFFSSKLLKACKDCFIGSRVLLLLNFNSETGIKVSFFNPLEFYYEVDEIDPDVISKVVVFTTTRDSTNKVDKRIFKKKYYMENGLCRTEEIIYNGRGEVIEEVTPDQATEFDYIPAYVIINDGLTGDLLGESEVEALKEYESYYSRLANGDIDAERKSMNPTKYAIDCDPNTTVGLSSSPGAFWDLASDPNREKDLQAQVGILEPSMTYKDAIKATLDRINGMMFEQVDVPNVNSEALQGVVTSGKTLKAIYWGLIVRCDEKMLVWRPAIEFLIETIIHGSILYPESAKFYVDEPIPTEFRIDINVENNYPLPEDEAEEKAIDIQEVDGKVLSKRSYMKKWHNYNEDEVDEELTQIQKEREQLEDSFSQIPLGGSITGDNDLDDKNEEENDGNNEDTAKGINQ